MIDEPLGNCNGSFFTLEVKISKDEMNRFKKKLTSNQNKTDENEWLQEYELIYLSHKHENWNLEETLNT